MTAATSKTIRPDYVRHTKWTYAEAAHHACVSEHTVRVWACRKKFKKGYMAGNLKVDASSFLRFLETGKAQK